MFIMGKSRNWESLIKRGTMMMMMMVIDPSPTQYITCRISRASHSLNRLALGVKPFTELLVFSVKHKQMSFTIILHSIESS